MSNNFLQFVEKADCILLKFCLALIKPCQMFSLIEDVLIVNKLLFSRFIYDKKAIKAKLKKNI